MTAISSSTAQQTCDLAEYFQRHANRYFHAGTEASHVNSADAALHAPFLPTTVLQSNPPPQPDRVKTIPKRLSLEAAVSWSFTTTVPVDRNCVQRDSYMCMWRGSCRWAFSRGVTMATSRRRRIVAESAFVVRRPARKPPPATPQSLPYRTTRRRSSHSALVHNRP
jgi:hypothetical protein